NQCASRPTQELVVDEAGGNRRDDPAVVDGGIHPRFNGEAVKEAPGRRDEGTSIAVQASAGLGDDDRPGQYRREPLRRVAHAPAPALSAGALAVRATPRVVAADHAACASSRLLWRPSDRISP